MRVLWVSALIVVVDQITKLVVKSEMVLGESIPVIGRLFRLTFTENPGMAFGLSIGSKLFLTLFSIAATILILVYLWRIPWAPYGYRLSLALVLGGALGNVIDRTFYGMAFGECAPSDPGLSRLFYGCVVDFVHFDVWRGEIFDRTIALFPIGNIADLAIIAGVVGILITQNRFHEAAEARVKGAATEPVVEPTA
ncbi:signal peptidase II [Rubrivirga sp.]|uniref:signal peptidase II n=1 Tax=Rubrivirga sp. TaxID=1885344 RepID=UPI003C71BDFA